MVKDRLARLYPKLYHMADVSNWENICKHGLLSTTALLDLFEYDGQKRLEIESQLRLRRIRITHPVHGETFIRDQYPMRDRPSEGVYLEKCLEGISLREWFELLNGKTFFWARLRGLNYMLGAKLYRGRNHCVITVRTRDLLKHHEDRVTLCAINSGSLYGSNAQAKRTRKTFMPLSEYNCKWVRELAVDYSVPDIMDLAISAKECRCVREDGSNVCKEIRHMWP